MSNGFLHLLPRDIPPLKLMLEDIGCPPPAVIAKALGVHLRTVERWLQQDRAPRAVLLALFFTTRWGQSAVNCQAENDARFYFGYAASLRNELDKANAQLARLGQIGDFGSANDPTPSVPSTPPAKASKLRRRPECPERAALAERRQAKRASGPPNPFDFLRTG